MADSKSMKRSTVFSALVILGAASAGIIAALNSWGGRIDVTRAASAIADRLPASIRRGANVAELEGSALRLASQRHLLEDMQLVSEKDRVGVRLGYFLTKNEEGNAAYACEVFKQITLSFVGEGVADSGDKPVMDVSAPCRETADSTMMEPIWIPLHELRGRSPSNADIVGPAADGGQNGTQTRVKFSNVGTEWPSQWALQSVRLSRNEAEVPAMKATGEDLSVSGDEMRNLVKKPFVIHW